MRSFFQIFLISFLALLTQSCVMDDYEPCVSDNPDNLETIGYMSIHLNSTAGLTRSRVGDDFNAGNSDEIALSSEANHFAIFYSETSDKPIAVASILNVNDGRDNLDGKNATFVLAAIAAKSEEREVLERLRDCYVVLNTDIKEDVFWTKTKNDLLKIEVESPYFISESGDKFHTMCNSVYVENGQKKIYTQVDNTKIFNEYQEALENAWKGIAAVNVYVERMSAKFSLTFENPEFNLEGADRVFEPKNNSMIVFTGINPAGIPYYENGPADNTGKKYSFKVRITGWGVNALERKHYLFRNFNAGGNYFTNWYNTEYKRAYWSEDLNYNKAVYPWQYRKVIDNSGLPVYSGKIVNGIDGNILKNLSFNELNENKFTQKYLYSPENTFNFADQSFNTSLDSRIEYLAGTHIIVCAEVLTNLEDFNQHKVGELYRDRNNNFYRSEKDAFKALLSSMNHSLRTHSSLKFTYYDWDQGGIELKLYAETKGDCGIYIDGMRLTPDNFELLTGELTADAEFKESDGKRIIWMDKLQILDENKQPIKIYAFLNDIDPSKNEFLRSATVNDFKSLIFEHVGALDHFKDGKMYYAVPIGYLQGSEGINSKYDVYGVVRNSEYQIKIHDVSGLGTSVDKLNEPIIPNSASTHDHLYTSFEILDWHVTEQDVPGVIQ